MGVDMLFVGYIQEAEPGRAGSNEEKQRKRESASIIMRHTDEVLGRLPEEDEWPPLCKAMFGWPPAHTPMITYWQRLVHFAASMKNADFVLRDWLDKFEGLLRQLYWEEAYLRIERGYIGTHEFRWKPKQDWKDTLYSGRLEPISDWEFTTTLKDLASLTGRERP